MESTKAACWVELTAVEMASQRAEMRGDPKVDPTAETMERRWVVHSEAMWAALMDVMKAA